MVLSQQNNSAVSVVEHGTLDAMASPETPAILTPPMDCQLQSFSACSVPILLVTNLPTVLFCSASDLYPLLCPFGDVVQLKVLNRPTAPDTLSVTVEYKTMIQAQEARESLDGQFYADRCVKAELLLPDPPPVNSEFSSWSAVTGDRKTGLNPFATPFQVQSGITSVPSPAFGPFKYQVQGCYGSDDELGSSCHWSGQSTPSLALPSQSSVYSGSGFLAPSFATFRPHSAPSQ